MEKITLKLPDESQMLCVVSRPKLKIKGGMIVFQEAFGVTKHVRELTKRFADEGYLTIAPELFHRTAKPEEIFPYDRFDLISPHISATTTEGMQQDARVCFDWLKSEGVEKIACIGFCMGGRASFASNAVLPLKAAISFYGSNIMKAQGECVSQQRAPLLFFWGGLDKHIDSDQIQHLNSALKEAGKRYTCVEISDAEHGFFTDDKSSYNPRASREAWSLVLQFIEEGMNSSVLK